MRARTVHRMLAGQGGDAAYARSIRGLPWQPSPAEVAEEEPLGVGQTRIVSVPMVAVEERGEVVAHRALSGRRAQNARDGLRRARCACVGKEGIARTKAVLRSRVFSLLDTSSAWVSTTILSRSSTSSRSSETSTTASSSSGKSPAVSFQSRRSSRSQAQYREDRNTSSERYFDPGSVPQRHRVFSFFSVIVVTHPASFT